MISNFRKLIKEYGAMQLLGSSGACACGELFLFGIHIETHCYKTTINGRLGGCECAGAGVHIWKDPDAEARKHELGEIGKLFQKYIEKAYSCSCNLVVGEEKK